MHTKPTKFKTLINNEMKRLESIIAQNEQIYPVAFRSYVFSRQLPSKHRTISPYARFFSFVRMVQFLF